MKLHELHVHEFRTGEIRQRLPVARAFPRVRIDRERSANPARCEDHSLRFEKYEPAGLAPVAECPLNAAVVGEETRDRALHVHAHPEMNPVLLKRADHLETGAVAYVREARIFVAPEV